MIDSKRVRKIEKIDSFLVREKKTLMQMIWTVLLVIVLMGRIITSMTMGGG